MPEVDHLIDAGAKEVVGHAARFLKNSQKLTLIATETRRSHYRCLPSNASIHAGYDTFAWPTIYKERAATAECVNALARNRGLQRLPVRGLAKVRSVVGLFVLAHNLMRMAKLVPELVGWSPGASAMTAQAA